MDDQYDVNAEAQHTLQMTWGDSELGEQLNDFKHRMYHAVLSKLTTYIAPSGSRLLDIGCSYGGFMQEARQSGFEVSGIDIVPQAVEHVQATGMNAQCCSRVREFSPQDERFDVISVLDANIYWPDQPAELGDILARLNPGGLLVMRVVDKSWMATVGRSLMQVSPDQGQKILRRAVNDHRFSMPIGSFLELLHKTGFRVISASPKGAVHSKRTSLLVKFSFAMGIALWHTLGVFLAPGAVIIAERP